MRHRSRWRHDRVVAITGVFPKVVRRAEDSCRFNYTFEVAGKAIAMLFARTNKFVRGSTRMGCKWFLNFNLSVV